jgi:hypothetical protein
LDTTPQEQDQITEFLHRNVFLKVTPFIKTNQRYFT